MRMKVLYFWLGSLASLSLMLGFLPTQHLMSFGMAPVRSPREISSKTLPSLKLKKIEAKGSTFTMGTSKKEQDYLAKTYFEGTLPSWLDSEAPHPVKFTNDYYLGVIPITRAQFAAFIKDCRYQTEVEKRGEGDPWNKPGFEQTDDHSVVRVTFTDAHGFCEWLSRKDGMEYRLPTEAEWEFACRAGGTAFYFFGDDPGKLGEYTWVGNNDKKFGSWVTVKKPNEWGLYDLRGNVFEFCSDLYGPYPKEAVNDPMGPKEGEDRVLRGSNNIDLPWRHRSASRDRIEAKVGSVDVGFRIAASAK